MKNDAAEDNRMNQCKFKPNVTKPNKSFEA